MNLTDAQRDAMLTLANTASGHDFVPQDVLDDLLTMGLVFWRTPDEVNLTPVGERVYQKLAAELSGDELTVSFL
jgi:hypothetical protein